MGSYDFHLGYFSADVLPRRWCKFSSTFCSKVVSIQRMESKVEGNEATEYKLYFFNLNNDLFCLKTFHLLMNK